LKPASVDRLDYLDESKRLFMSKLKGMALPGGLFALILIGGIWAWLHILSLSHQVDQATVDQAAAAATVRALRSELDMVRSQANASATAIVDLHSQLQAAQLSTKASVENLSFVSDYDGTTQRYLLITPAARDTTPKPLVVYLHSMGNGMDEISKWRTGEESLIDALMRRQVILASPAYRGDSWLNPAATADVSKMIRGLKERFAISRIIVSGFSMGGSAAVMYPLVAPPDISVDGIVAAGFASDVIDLWTEPGNAQVKESLRNAFNGSPIQQPQVYEERALLRQITRLSPAVPVALFSSYSDSMIPTQQQVRLREAIAKRGNPMLFEQIPGDHQVDSLNEGFEFVLNRLSRQ
jgi:acetyl esterase/lipase